MSQFLQGTDINRTAAVNNKVERYSGGAQIANGVLPVQQMINKKFLKGRHVLECWLDFINCLKNLGYIYIILRFNVNQ